MSFPTAATIASILTSHRYHFANELELHAGLARVLESAGVAFFREHPLDPFGRIDFLCYDASTVPTIGMEVKIREPRAAVLRQLTGYASHPQIASLILVTTRFQLRSMPPELNGKPLAVCFIGGAL